MAKPAFTAVLVILVLFIGIQVGGRLITEKSPIPQEAITSAQTQSEFGLQNFGVFSSGSLGEEMATLMDYENE